MIIKLIKKNRKTTDIVIFKFEDGLVEKKEGKLGKNLSSSFGGFDTNNKAAIDGLIKQYLDKGFVHSDEEIIEYEVFDKAKWHYEGDFPAELDSYQGYIHTGFYLGWLTLNNLISEEFKSLSATEIQKFLNKEITSVELYRDQLDGVFTSNDVTYEGFRFTKQYFDFETGLYPTDYEKTLASNLPGSYYVKDTWGNFNKICNVLNQRYESFLDTIPLSV